MKNSLCLLLFLFVGNFFAALSAEELVSGSDSLRVQQNVVLVADTVSKANKQKKCEKYPSAVDNSARLLAVADSLAKTGERVPREGMMYLPVVFVSYETVSAPKIHVKEWKSKPAFQLRCNDAWYRELTRSLEFEKYHLMQLAINTPWLVPYNIDMMPEPPKQYEITTDVKKNILTIKERKMESTEATIAPPEIKQRNWLHAFDASLQFSQSYLSENWYQGGTKNLNLISNINYNLKLNQTLHPKLLYELSVQYKLGVNSAPEDELRGYNINEDLFQLITKFGLKATKKFYYSMNVQFKTQLFQNFTTNTWDLAASFLTPGELNVGIGMTYSTKNEKRRFSFDASLSPLSYNMKICRATHKMDPTTYGIEAGKHLGHEVGSSGECKITWNITRDISVTSRLFAFSNYSYVQGDWETTINFSINKFLSTQFYAHLRYDDSAAWNPDWRYWQFKEIFSFGLQYKFSI